jgi:hypothetical protein
MISINIKLEEYDQDGRNIVKEIVKKTLCPLCKSNMKYNSYYERYMTVKNETRLIKVHRMECNSKKCGHSHAIVPRTIMPYRTVPFNVVIYCLEKIINKELTIYKIKKMTEEKAYKYSLLNLIRYKFKKWQEIIKSYKEVKTNSLEIIEEIGKDLMRPSRHYSASP